MPKKCSSSSCPAPKGVCEEFIEDHRQCSHWNETPDEIVTGTKNKKGRVKVIPWTGLALEPEEIELVAHRSTPTIIGIIGAQEAGKTSYLGMLYTLLFNGKRFKDWNFAGSYTLNAWENLAKFLKIKSNGKVDFPPPTPSDDDFYSLYHLALRNENHFYDVFFADSSGEVFTNWASNVDHLNAKNARWIYQHSNAFIFFVDCESIIEQRSAAKRRIAQLAGQVATNLQDRPVVVVWSKADRIDEILPPIKKAIETVITRNFPQALTLQISNFSEKDPDTLCHINNLLVTESLLNSLSTVKPFTLVPHSDDNLDFFFRFKGSYENE